MTDRPVVAAYGGGVNSTAMLIGMQERAETVDRILFADTGGETPETMRFVARFSAWLTTRGLPEIETVRKITKRAGKFRGAGEVLTLERRCLEEKTLPSIAYGFKTCSQKFKRQPQESAISSWSRARDTWKAGGKVLRLIGYDAGEPWRAKDIEEARYDYRYPLIEWGWDREECIEAIQRAELCVPPKSSCFFCPNMTEAEIFQLRDEHPELLERALAMERNAMPTAGSSIKGLAREISWQQILTYDEQQGSFFPRVMPKIPCGCYDGG